MVGGRDSEGLVLIRIFADVALIAGALAFVVTLWGLPEFWQFGKSLLLAILVAAVTFVVPYAVCRYFGLLDSSDEISEQVGIRITPGSHQGSQENSYSSLLDGVPEGMAVKPKPDPFPKKWSADLIDQLEWKVFRDVCEAYWQEKPNTIVDNKVGGYPNVSFFICVRGDGQRKIGVVQCKSGQSNLIGIAELRALMTAKKENSLPLSILMYAGKLTNVAHSFAEKNDIKLLSSEQIYQGLAALSTEKQDALMRQLIRPDYMIPSCPNCDIKMVKRRRRDSGVIFWGCLSYPECKEIKTFHP